MPDVVTRDLGSVIGPQGPQGPQGNDYVLTAQDKTEIAQQVGEMDFLPAAVITVDCINDYSELPIYATVKLLNADGELMEQSTYAAAQKKFLVTPFTDYILRFEADGYQTVDDYPIDSIPKSGLALTKRFLPSVTPTFTVDYKVDGVTVQHDVVDPHGSVSYTGSDVSVAGKVWIGWDDESGDGNLTDVTEDTVVNAAFVVPVQPAEVKDMSLYDYIYSDMAGDNAAYTQAEFAWILLNNMAKTYWAIGNKINMKVADPTLTGDVSLHFVLEAFNHFRLAGSNDFALTTWLTEGVLTAARRLNSSNTNVGGWPAMEAHTTIETQYFAKFPRFYKSLIREVEVLSSAGGMSAAIVSANQHLWFPSYCELFNTPNETPYKDEIATGAEAKHFSRYTNSAARTKRTYNNTGTAYYWWLRSPDPSSSSNFRIVGSSGNAYSDIAPFANYWALGFCI